MIDYHKEWLASVQLEQQAAFQFGAIVVAVFQQKDQPRYFSFMFRQRVSWCAESYLEDLTVLDTTNSGSLDLFPRPGAYKQKFPGMSVQETWQRHLGARPISPENLAANGHRLTALTLNYWPRRFEFA